tara:strand:+ start:1478 stop:1891 length:414 start_codon:yes stop_codon:yes gene_type:complete
MEEENTSVDKDQTVQGRHGCLWTTLVLFGLLSSYSLVAGVIFELLEPEPDFHSNDALLFLGTSGLYLVCVIGLFRWQKWAFWGFVGVSALICLRAVVIVAQGSYSQPPVPGVSFIPCIILYAALQIGGESNGWRKLR